MLNSRELWLTKSDTGELVFRKPLLVRVGAFFGIGLFVRMFIRTDVVAQHNPWAVVPMVGLIFVLIVMFSYIAGPEETIFDLRCRRYCQKTGFFWLYFRREGTFNEITGFLIQQTGNRKKRNTTYYNLSVILDRPNRRWKWRNVLTDYPSIGYFSDSVSVQRQAQELAQALDIPCNLFAGSAWGFISGRMSVPATPVG